uniref:Uncharacterized protein n=1 Tax=Anopheles maculatus TaxID=74869 RepID=A0A182TB71_9DIPT
MSRKSARASDIVNNNVVDRCPQEATPIVKAGSQQEQKLTTMERPLHQQQQQYNFNGHVIRPRIRSSNSMSSSSSTASNYHHHQHHASNGSNSGGKHVEWSDDDHLHDDGYFSSDTRRRRSGTWPCTPPSKFWKLPIETEGEMIMTKWVGTRSMILIRLRRYFFFNINSKPAIVYPGYRLVANGLSYR